MAKETVGSWFTSGFFGYSKLNEARNDFHCEYRQLAKPLPPDRFVWRSKQPVRHHTFTRHDNKNTFFNDAQFLGQNLDHKCTPAPSLISKNNMMFWLPDKAYLERPNKRLTTYQTSYRNRCDPVPQLLTKHLKSFFDERPATTTYRYTHGNDNPHKPFLELINKDIIKLNFKRNNRPKTAPPSIRETVATCLNWHIPTPPKQPPVPSAAPRVVFNSSGYPQPVLMQKKNIPTTKNYAEIPMTAAGHPCSGSDEAKDATVKTAGIQTVACMESQKN